MIRTDNRDIGRAEVVIPKFQSFRLTLEAAKTVTQYYVYIVTYLQILPDTCCKAANMQKSQPKLRPAYLLEPAVSAEVEVGVAGAHDHRRAVEVVAVARGVGVDGEEAHGLRVLAFSSFAKSRVAP